MVGGNDLCKVVTAVERGRLVLMHCWRLEASGGQHTRPYSRYSLCSEDARAQSGGLGLRPGQVGDVTSLPTQFSISIGCVCLCVCNYVASINDTPSRLLSRKQCSVCGIHSRIVCRNQKIKQRHRGLIDLFMSKGIKMFIFLESAILQF